MSTQKPLVSIVIITYGHEAFIKQAIEGVLMQECDFEVELIIANDCSPDNTDFVVKEILDNHPRAHWIKYTKHKANKGMMSNFIWALDQCQCKYIALCEGDDYWTDPLKLQKQVDFLEKNEEYGLIHTNFASSIEKTKSFKYKKTLNYKTGLFSEDIEDLFLSGKIIRTCTVLFRRRHIDDLMKFYDFYKNEKFVSGDYPMFYSVQNSSPTSVFNYRF